ncbi:spermidine/putrescine ABC transporter substrate-binding protein [Nocardioides sp. W7]|uniref:polyamine ABC transporter substrate-binding protein n=1 Tax=Nocardioides sp. W7 TaxID=2931390 RepID=UPI001FD5092E|nr:spermidine/putrescine ABC transporter substrate-binding protein [Nocardioides sp. W7]
MTLKFLNYGDWVGKTEIADFEKANPGIKIKQYALPEGGSSALAAQLAKDKGAYDLVAVGNATAARLEAGKLLADFDPASVPNLENIPEEYLEQFPWGIPTDLGKVGIIYDKEKVANPPASWQELFDDAEQWSGKIVLPDYDLDVQAIALLALGYDINTTDEGELAEAEEKVKDLKPDLLAFQGDGRAKSVIDGSALIAVGYDYEFAGAEDDSIGWVSPSEGTPGYIEGVAVLPGSEHVEEALAFLDSRLEPETYAGLINNTGSSYLMPAAEEFIDESILTNPALQQNPDSPFVAEQFLSAEDTEIRAKMWNRIKAS